MRIRLLSITHKVPAWICEGFNEYAKRLPAACTLELIEISPIKRIAGIPTKRLIEEEGKKMLAAVKPSHYVIALDVKGKLWTSEALAKEMAIWQEQGRHIDLLIGGADGLSSECLAKADQKWSLSPLTFPHQLVRVIVAEQIYRALMILQNHPYHR